MPQENFSSNSKNKMTKLNATDLGVSLLYILASLVSMKCDLDPWNFQFVAPIAITTADMAALVPVHVGNGALARNTLAQGVWVPTVCNNNNYTSEILKSCQTCQPFSLILLIMSVWKTKIYRKSNTTFISPNEILSVKTFGLTLFKITDTFITLFTQWHNVGWTRWWQ